MSTPEEFDIDRACENSVKFLQSQFDLAERMLGLSTDWTRVPFDLRGHPVHTLKSLIFFNETSIMPPEQRDSFRVEIVGYGCTLVNLGIISRELFYEMLCERDK